MAFEVFCKRRFFHSRLALEFNLHQQNVPAALRGLSGTLCCGLFYQHLPAAFPLGSQGDFVDPQMMLLRARGLALSGPPGACR